jgi:site-specific recombinase XerD
MADSVQKYHVDFLEDLEIGQGRSEKTVENYDRYLKRYYSQQSIEKVSDITPESVRQFRRYLNEVAPVGSEAGVSLATSNYHLIALRQFLKYLTKRDVSALSPDKVGLAKTGERDIDVLYPEEIDALIASTKQGIMDEESNVGMSALRDSAILEVLYSTGMRVAELVSLNRDDLKGRGGRPIESGGDIRSELAVRGKGSKVRVVFLSKSAREAVAQYLKKRDDMDPALFVRHSPNLSISDDMRLRPRSVQRMIKKYAVMSGLTKTITPHTLRHSFATDLLTNGADVRQVQQLLGHASITTTQVYTHLTDVHLKDVHTRFHRKKKHG